MLSLKGDTQPTIILRCVIEWVSNVMSPRMTEGKAKHQTQQSKLITYYILLRGTQNFRIELSGDIDCCCCYIQKKMDSDFLKTSNPNLTSLHDQWMCALEFIVKEAHYVLHILSQRKVRLFPTLMFLLLFFETILIGGYIMNKVMYIAVSRRDRRYLQMLRRSEHEPIVTVREARQMAHGTRFLISWQRLLSPIFCYILFCIAAHLLDILFNICRIIHDGPESLHGVRYFDNHLRDLHN